MSLMAEAAATTPGPAASDLRVSAGAGKAASVSVLIVDDDADHVDLVRRALRRHELAFEVTHARDGFACLEALASRAYSIVLLDYRLPRMTGLEVLARIHERGLSVPVVIATGQGDERIAVEAMKAGAIDYVVKTAGYFATLPTVLHKVLKQHELALENTRLYAEAQRQQARLAQIFDSTSDGVVLVDGDGRVMFANRRAGELLAFDCVQAVGVALDDLVGGLAARGSTRPALLRLPMSGEGAEGDLEAAPGRRILHWTTQPTTDAAGRPVGFTVTFRDVTEERQISQMKSDFVSFVAHQLRTPLSGIKWMLELARQEPDVPPELQSYVEDAAASAERLIVMVNDLLDISRLENGSLTVVAEETPLGGLTRSVLDDLNAVVAEKGHRVSVSEEPDLPILMLDRQLCRQLLVNLISNAIKYTPPEGDIGIRMYRQDATVRWEIHDSGIGIPETAHGRLFEKFYRADNALTVETEGTGLGLYLVRLIAELFGGNVTWTSETGRGTRFVITLPVEKPA